jgi:hypothetical protein
MLAYIALAEALDASLVTRNARLAQASAGDRSTVELSSTPPTLLADQERVEVRVAVIDV